jgi:hypothetical protein
MHRDRLIVVGSRQARLRDIRTGSPESKRPAAKGYRRDVIGD